MPILPQEAASLSKFISLKLEMSGFQMYLAIMNQSTRQTMASGVNTAQKVKKSIVPPV